MLRERISGYGSRAIRLSVVYPLKKTSARGANRSANERQQAFAAAVER
jgi:hypothetical protein